MKLTREQWEKLHLDSSLYYLYERSYFTTFKVEKSSFENYFKLLGIREKELPSLTMQFLTHKNKSYLLALAVQLRLSLR